jgi:polyhydroxyalkanoate synthesis regulator phasin
LAKRTSRKQTKAKGSRKASNTRRSKAPAARTARTGRKAKTARAVSKSRTSRRKNAARSAASRTTRQEAPPQPPSTLAATTTALKGAVASAVAAVTKRLPKTPVDMDAITLLERDHRRLEDLLERGEATTERARQARRELLATITAELGVHELIEEKLLYPALKKYPEARDIVLEGFQEHHVADLIVTELQDVATDDEQWGAKFKVLKENIEHHIEEEEGPMFRTARGVMSREDLQRLGRKMAAMKREAESARR